MTVTEIQTILGGTGGIILLLMTAVQFSKIEINPWSWIAKHVGRAINGELIEKVNKLQEDIEKLNSRCDERDAILCRTRILRFDDEILHDVKHTRGHFEQVLTDIKTYEDFCKDHPKFPNNIAVSAISNIERTYEKCKEDRTFL